MLFFFFPFISSCITFFLCTYVCVLPLEVGVTIKVLFLAFKVVARGVNFLCLQVQLPLLCPHTTNNVYSYKLHWLIPLNSSQVYS